MRHGIFNCLVGVFNHFPITDRYGLAGSFSQGVKSRPIKSLRRRLVSPELIEGAPIYILFLGGSGPYCRSSGGSGAGRVFRTFEGLFNFLSAR